MTKVSGFSAVCMASCIGTSPGRVEAGVAASAEPLRTDEMQRPLAVHVQQLCRRNSGATSPWPTSWLTPWHLVWLPTATSKAHNLYSTHWPITRTEYAALFLFQMVRSAHVQYHALDMVIPVLILPHAAAARKARWLVPAGAEVRLHQFVHGTGTHRPGLRCCCHDPESRLGDTQR